MDYAASNVILYHVLTLGLGLASLGIITAGVVLAVMAGIDHIKGSRP